jgi:tRNA threonylcarbamoyladenosine biosynthesis protein TsaB
LDCVSEPAVFVGDGLRRYASTIHSRFGKNVIFAAATFNVPRGSNIARLGYERILNGQSDDYFSLTPNYVRAGSSD